jgi:hypothetical protein
VRRCLTLIAAFALLVRGLIPVGYMLAPAAAGEMTVVICTGHGPQLVIIDAEGKPVPAKPAVADGGLCAYASPGATTLADAAATPIAAEVRYAAAVYRVARTIFQGPTQTDASSPRGPPSELI